VSERPGTIPPDYLAKPGGVWRRLSLMHVCVLMYHVWKAENDPEVGFDDAANTVLSMTRKLNRKVYIDPAILDSAMWACNIMNEQGKFEHPLGLTFDEWTQRVIGARGHFNRDYNTVEWNPTKRGKM
jgi:hypothetical protein